MTLLSLVVVSLFVPPATPIVVVAAVVALNWPM